jgi:hypothetical protein
VCRDVSPRLVSFLKPEQKPVVRQKLGDSVDEMDGDAGEDVFEPVKGTEKDMGLIPSVFLEVCPETLAGSPYCSASLSASLPPYLRWS